MYIKRLYSALMAFDIVVAMNKDNNGTPRVGSRWFERNAGRRAYGICILSSIYAYVLMFVLEAAASQTPLQRPKAH